MLTELGRRMDEHVRTSRERWKIENRKEYQIEVTELKDN